MTRRRNRCLLGVALLGCCPGLACSLASSRPIPSQQRFASQQDAGAVQISVQSVAPFEEYVDALQPRFALTPDAAFETAIADTQLAELRALRSALFSAGVTVPTSAVDGGATTLTPPSAPAAAAGTLTPIDISSRTVALDPSLRYRAAAALMQEVALLSSYVRDAAVSTNTAPYVVRFLVTVLPSARRIPYDVYSAVSLFADTNGEPGIYGRGTRREVERDFKKGDYDFTEAEQHSCLGTPVDVVPLFVTDNVESSVLAASREEVGGAAAAAGGTVANLGLTAGGRIDGQNGARTMGRDINSLFTLGRASGNTLETRLGAFSVEGTFHTVPRTYSLTALALVPGKRDAHGELILPCTAVRFTARSEFRDADTGQLLRRPSSAQLKEAIRGRLAEEGVRLAGPPELAARLKGRKVTADPWYEAILAGDFEVYLASFQESSHSGAERLWPDLVSWSRRWGWSSGRFEVPLGGFRYPGDTPDGAPRIPLVDDGEKAEITMVGARGLRSEGLSGFLRFSDQKGIADVVVVATAAVASKDGRAATITFPSPRKTLNGSDVRFVDATVTYISMAYRWNEGQNWSWSQRETPVLRTEPARKKEPECGFAAAASAPFIVADKDGAGEIRLQVRRSGTVDGRPLSARIHIQTEGAHVAKSVPALATDGADLLAELDRAYLLSLKGLLPGSTVRVRSFRKAGDATVAGPEIPLLVVRGDAKAGPASAAGGVN
jgi:hypothetical protein